MSETDYSAVDSLRKEVEEFQKTNRFNPLTVTNTFAQAKALLNYVDELEEQLETLTRAVTSLRGANEGAIHLLKRRP